MALDKKALCRTECATKNYWRTFTITQSSEIRHLHGWPLNDLSDAECWKSCCSWEKELVYCTAIGLKRVSSRVFIALLVPSCMAPTPRQQAIGQHKLTPPATHHTNVHNTNRHLDISSSQKGENKWSGRKTKTGLKESKKKIYHQCLPLEFTVETSPSQTS